MFTAATANHWLRRDIERGRQRSSHHICAPHGCFPRITDGYKDCCETCGAVVVYEFRELAIRRGYWTGLSGCGCKSTEFDPEAPPTFKGK